MIRSRFFQSLPRKSIIDREAPRVEGKMKAFDGLESKPAHRRRTEEFMDRTTIKLTFLLHGFIGIRGWPTNITGKHVYI